MNTLFHDILIFGCSFIIDQYSTIFLNFSHTNYYINHIYAWLIIKIKTDLLDICYIFKGIKGENATKRETPNLQMFGLLTPPVALS